MISVLDSRSRSTAMFDASTVLRIHTFFIFKKMCLARSIAEGLGRQKAQLYGLCLTKNPSIEFIDGFVLNRVQKVRAVVLVLRHCTMVVGQTCRDTIVR